MECYENMFYHMWKCTHKHFVLVLPAVNEVLLQALQERVKLSKNITIICPESHEQYPKWLPLSACLLYSKEALCKLKAVLEGKKGVIIPGRRSQNSLAYEYYLSELLNCPIFSTLDCPTLSDAKRMWTKHNIPTAAFRVLEPKSTIEAAIMQLAELMLEHHTTKTWMFKINGEFNGRGIATFNTHSSKKLKQMMEVEGIYLKEKSAETFSSRGV
jgi:hypothetical protein